MIALPSISSKDVDNTGLLTQLRQVLRALEGQINAQPTVFSNANSRAPEGARYGDIVFTMRKGVLRIGIFDGKTNRYLNTNDLQSLQSNGTNFVGYKTGTTGPANPVTRTTYFPNDKDWGFYFHSTGPAFYLFFNDNGTNRSVAM